MLTRVRQLMRVVAALLVAGVAYAAEPTPKQVVDAIATKMDLTRTTSPYCNEVGRASKASTKNGTKFLGYFAFTGLPFSDSALNLHIPGLGMKWASPWEEVPKRMGKLRAFQLVGVGEKKVYYVFVRDRADFLMDICFVVTTL
jgi:hypothetical protein